MMVRSNVGAKTTLANAVMAADLVAISGHHQVQQFLYLQVELQHKSLQENSTFAPSLTMHLLFVGGRTQKGN
jgi:hypothetical protein